MDERELPRLLDEAAGDAPEASFTAEDVTAASRRITRRRRTAVASVAGAVVLLAGGGVVAGSVVGDSTEPANSVAEGIDGEVSSAETGATGQPDGADERVPSTRHFPEFSPKQGGETDGEDGPRAGRTAGCDSVDRELAAALAGELPVGPEAEPVPSPVGLACAGSTRAAAYRLDGATISVILVPPGLRLLPPESPEGQLQAEHRTADEATVVVVRTPEPDAPGGSATVGPVTRDQLDDLAAALATSLGG